MIATSGDRLLDADAEAGIRELARRADLITPNVPELAVLAGGPVAQTWPDALAQARRVAAKHAVRVLAKGGHLAGAEAPDALVEPDGTTTEFPGRRIDTTNTHGTGCSLSSAVATLRPPLGFLDGGDRAGQGVAHREHPARRGAAGRRRARADQPLRGPVGARRHRVGCRPRVLTGVCGRSARP